MLHLVKRAAGATKTRMGNQARAMSDAHAAPPAEGLEAKVRHYLPHNHQIVLATLGAYTGLYLFFKILPSSKKEEAPATSSSSSSASSAIPSLFDEEFDEWSKQPGNMERWEQSLDKLE